MDAVNGRHIGRWNQRVHVAEELVYGVAVVGSTSILSSGALSSIARHALCHPPHAPLGVSSEAAYASVLLRNAMGQRRVAVRSGTLPDALGPIVPSRADSWRSSSEVALRCGRASGPGLRRIGTPAGPPSASPSASASAARGAASSPAGDTCLSPGNATSTPPMTLGSITAVKSPRVLTDKNHTYSALKQLPGHEAAPSIGRMHACTCSALHQEALQ